MQTQSNGSHNDFLSITDATEVRQEQPIQVIESAVEGGNTLFTIPNRYAIEVSGKGTKNNNYAIDKVFVGNEQVRSGDFLKPSRFADDVLRFVARRDNRSIWLTYDNPESDQQLLKVRYRIYSPNGIIQDVITKEG